MVIYKYGGSKPMDMRIVESLGEDVIETEPVDEQKFTTSSVISGLIQKEWESVDEVNGYMMLAQEIDNPELIDILNMMIDDIYTHIGQLEGLLQNQIPEAETIDTAKDSVDEPEEFEDEID